MPFTFHVATFINKVIVTSRGHPNCDVRTSSGGTIHMRSHLFVALTVSLAMPGVAAAQARMPHEGASAVGAEVGIFLPHETGMTTGPAIEGSYETYLSARDSLRLGVGWANPKQEANDANKMRQIHVGGDLVHNW